MTGSESRPNLVLVTGATGYIARHVVVQLLEAGWTVRGTARGAAGAGSLADRLHRLRADMTPHLADRAALERFTLVAADLTADDGWAEAVAGCSHVCHVASPVPGGKGARRVDMIAPTVDGTRRVLRAAAAAGVRRVVLTSSIAAVLYGVDRRDRVFTENDWSNSDSPRLGPYERSKTLAERAAWDFVADPSTGTVELATINPGLVLGPLIGQETSTSNEAVRRLLARELPACPDITCVFVDVRDVAAAHVAALTASEAAGRRYLCGIGGHSLLEVASILAREYGPKGYRVPTRRLPNWMLRLYALFDRAAAVALNDLANPQHIDNGNVIALLGRPLRDLREMTVAMAASLEAHGLVHPRAGATAP